MVSEWTDKHATMFTRIHIKFHLEFSADSIWCVCVCVCTDKKEATSVKWKRKINNNTVDVGNNTPLKPTNECMTEQPIEPENDERKKETMNYVI